MKISILIPVMSLALAVGCSSTKKEDEKGVLMPEREFKQTYVVQDASNPRFADWIEEPQKWANREEPAEVKENKYFATELTDLMKDKRMCIKSAEARATARVAGEILQFIKDSYAESIDDAGDGRDIISSRQETLAQEIQSFVTGASVAKTYWEERIYKVDLGALEDKSGYTCSALIKIPRKTLAKAVEQAAKKVAGEVTDPETKTNVKKALKDVAKKFDELDSPVKIEKGQE